jgi:hypothetical protein
LCESMIFFCGLETGFTYLLALNLNFFQFFSLFCVNFQQMTHLHLYRGKNYE